MNIKLNFEGGSFLAGFVLAMVIFKGLTLWWCLLVPLLLCDFEVKGMPYIRFNYENGKLKIEKGRH